MERGIEASCSDRRARDWSQFVNTCGAAISPFEKGVPVAAVIEGFGRDAGSGARHSGTDAG